MRRAAKVIDGDLARLISEGSIGTAEVLGLNEDDVLLGAWDRDNDVVAQIEDYLGKDNAQSRRGGEYKAWELKYPAWVAWRTRLVATKGGVRPAVELKKIVAHEMHRKKRAELLRDAETYLRDRHLEWSEHQKMLALAKELGLSAEDVEWAYDDVERRVGAFTRSEPPAPPPPSPIAPPQANGRKRKPPIAQASKEATESPTGKSFRLPRGFRLNLAEHPNGIDAFRTVPRNNANPLANGVRVNSGLMAESVARQTLRQLEIVHDGTRATPAFTVAWFENQVALLTSLHTEVYNAWNWIEIAARPPPPAPTYPQSEQAAIHAMQTWQPSVADRLFGREDSIRRRQVDAIERARTADAAAYQQARHDHGVQFAQWQWFTAVAKGIRAGNVDAYDAALRNVSPFGELPQLGSNIEAHALAPLVAEARFIAHSERVIPPELVSLTKTGKLSRKTMPVQRFWTLYQEHICSATFRIGRELFALLPVSLALVHARVAGLDLATGMRAEPIVMSVAFTRSEFARLNLLNIKPSEALSLFPHNMDFSGKKGFSPVPEIALRDLLAAAGIDDCS